MNEANETGRGSVRRTVMREAAWIGGAVVLALVFMYVLLALAFSGFGDRGLTNGIYAQNRTAGDLTFRVLLETGWFNVPGVAEPYVGSHPSNLLVAGASLLDRNQCTTGPMVALAQDGREIARREPPVCLGDDGQELWVIGPAAGSPSD